MEPIVRWSARDLVRVPGLISLSRVALAAVFPLLLGRGWLALGVLVIAGASDVLDGWYARRFHQTSWTGAVVDGFSDKLFAFSVLVTLLAGRRLSVVEASFLCTRELGELVLAVWWRLTGARVLGRSANVGGKLATVLQYVAVIAVLFNAPYRSAFIASAACAGAFAVVAYARSEAD